LEDIGQRAPNERRQQLLVRRAPRDLLDPHAHAGVAALELGQQLLHDFAFATHRPESVLVQRRRVSRTADDGQRKQCGRGVVDERAQSCHGSAPG
jgi:hypothetical protein